MNVPSLAPRVRRKPFTRAGWRDQTLALLAGFAFGPCVSGCSAKSEHSAPANITVETASSGVSSAEPERESNATSSADSLPTATSDGARASGTTIQFDSGPDETETSTGKDDATSSQVASGIGDSSATSNAEDGTEQTSRPVIPVVFTACA